MNGIILASKRTYSLAQHKPIVEWHQMQDDIPVNMPRNYNVRCVDAELAGKSLSNEFEDELRLDWSRKDAIINKCKNKYGTNLTDIAVFLPKLNVALILQSHLNDVFNTIINILSIDDLKKALI